MGDVIQFLYGEDGMDGAAIESQTMEHLRWDRKKLEVCFTLWLSVLLVLVVSKRCLPVLRSYIVLQLVSDCLSKV